MMWYRKLTRQQKIRRWAGALWTTPLIMLLPLWLGALYVPSVILDYPDVFLLFFAVPFAAAAILYVYAAKVGHSNSKETSDRS